MTALHRGFTPLHIEGSEHGPRRFKMEVGTDHEGHLERDRGTCAGADETEGLAGMRGAIMRPGRQEITRF